MPLQKASARMAESVDALVSNTSRFTPVPVRPRLRVRKEKFERTSLFLYPSLRSDASVVVWQSCLRYISVGELLRNYQPCADSLKVNYFFFLSAQCLQLCCSPPLHHLALLKPAANVRPTIIL